MPIWPVYLRHGEVFLAATLRAPSTITRRALVYSHGWGGRRDASHHADLLDRLSQAGVASISLDQRGYFDSTGTRDLSAWPDDMLFMVRYLVARGFDRVWVGGLSTGGAMALVTAARDPALAGVLALSPFASLERVLAERPDLREFLSDRFGGLGSSQMSTGDALGQVDGIAPRPCLIVHALDDREFSPDHARALHAATPTSTLWTLDVAGHTLTGGERAGLLARIVEWITNQ